MTRKKVKSFRLFSRVSENSMTKNELEFIEEQLENQTKAQFVRQSVKIYHKYYTGELFKEILDKIDVKEIEPEENLEDEYGDQLDRIKEKGFFN